MTPEGKVKAAISRELARYKPLYKFMPVPHGYGPSSLDYLVCVEGHFLAIEAKAPGGRPTRRQLKIIDDIRRAGGTALVVSSIDEAKTLIPAFFESLKQHVASSRQ